MKKNVFKLTIIVLFLILMTGCSTNKIVIYSSMEEERNQALKDQIKDKFPDYNIVVQSISTGNSAAKIKNEKTNIEADIVLDLETGHLENLKDNFADISKIDTSIYDDDINNTDKYLIWCKYTIDLIVDNSYLKKHNLKVPKTYQDLLKPEYKGLIAMPDPKTSGTGYAFFLNAVNEMGEKEAISYFKKLNNNIREYTTSGSGPTNLLKQGEIAIAVGMTSQGVAAINDGYDFSIVELSTGSMYNTTGFAVIKGKESKTGVMEVYNWLLSDFLSYDKAYFIPNKVLKKQEVKIKNYPTDLKDANMNGIDDISVKSHLMEVWGKING